MIAQAGVSGQVGVIVLAAGASRRLRSPKQLLTEHDGSSLLHRIVCDADRAGYAPIIVVLGAHADEVAPTVVHPSVRVVVNPDWETGIASSVSAGLNALQRWDGLSGVLLLTCDQPAVHTEHLRAMLALFREHDECIASSYAGALGVPVIWPLADWPRLSALEGDRGARVLLTGTERSVPLVDGELDLDTAHDVERWRAGYREL